MTYYGIWITLDDGTETWLRLHDGTIFYTPSKGHAQAQAAVSSRNKAEAREFPCWCEGKKQHEDQAG
jgi:hypothetical protein